MVNNESVLILSGFLFCLGFLGLLKQTSIVKTVISIEIMMFASIVNFAYICGENPIGFGHFAILTAFTLGGLTLSIVFVILTLQLKEDKDTSLLEEDSIVISLEK